MFSMVDRCVALYLLKSSLMPDVLAIAREARGRWACTVRGDRLRAISARSEFTNAGEDAQIGMATPILGDLHYLIRAHL
ncbi:MAG: hypothetical protein CMD92_08110 [Gammaproteobacteria bacterium]|nr:hypothetical protein [Gammaproteobacteria bacterium]